MRPLTVAAAAEAPLSGVARIGKVEVLCCGGERDAIRMPYKLGLRAYAYLRYRRMILGLQVGDVLADRRGRGGGPFVYLFVRPGSSQSHPELGVRRGADEPLLLGPGCYVAFRDATTLCTPVYGHWINGPTGAVTDTEVALEALTYAQGPPVRQWIASGWVAEVEEIAARKLGV